MVLTMVDTISCLARHDADRGSARRLPLSAIWTAGRLLLDIGARGRPSHSDRGPDAGSCDIAGSPSFFRGIRLTALGRVQAVL